MLDFIIDAAVERQRREAPSRGFVAMPLAAIRADLSFNVTYQFAVVLPRAVAAASAIRMRVSPQAMLYAMPHSRFAARLSLRRYSITPSPLSPLGTGFQHISSSAGRSHDWTLDATQAADDD